MTSSTENQQCRPGDFLVSTDRARLDVDPVHELLTHCDWAKGIPKPTVIRSLENFLCLGASRWGRQVGFARVISGFATYACVGDVFVVDA